MRCTAVTVAALGSLLLSILQLAGCDSAAVSTSQPPAAVQPRAEEDLPQVDHPEYANWRRFPAGTVVVRQKEVKSESGAVAVTTKLRLVEVTPARVVVETQITVQRTGQPADEKPAFELEFPATFPLPSGMELAQFVLPSLKAKAIGTEVRQAAGQTFQTELFSWDEATEAGPMTVQWWRSDDVPGRMLRQEITGRNHVSVEEVVEIVQPKLDAAATM